MNIIPFGRQSLVHDIKLRTLAFSSTLQIGDSCRIRAVSNVLAIQRERELFFDDEGKFEDYPIFSEPIPLTPITTPVKVNTLNANGTIKVTSIDITGVSSASILHIGNTDDVYLENRTHHIRQLIDAE
ncbi:spore germination protein GerPE [Falsibacillus pallidus]|uniref:spore germination protein GerPE n=1 Tax=Falsibacillus pallidus TaxID=493781 RepID=UPI003D9702D8